MCWTSSLGSKEMVGIQNEWDEQRQPTSSVCEKLSAMYQKASKLFFLKQMAESGLEIKLAYQLRYEGYVHHNNFMYILHFIHSLRLKGYNHFGG